MTIPSGRLVCEESKKEERKIIPKIEDWLGEDWGQP
jgi:hypothetical protein